LNEQFGWISSPVLVLINFLVTTVAGYHQITDIIQMFGVVLVRPTTTWAIF
jgi:hypothetical protein